MSTAETINGAEMHNHAGRQTGLGQGFFSGGTFVNRKLEYGIVDGLAVFEGDIILGRADQVRTTPEIVNAGIVVTGVRFRWPNRTIPFVVDPNLPNPQRVTDAIAHWQAHTVIRFVARTTQADFVTFRPGDGCSSSVGRQRGEQLITLGAGCSTGNTIHEIGHSVGLWHEQSREDRDSHVIVDFANVIPEFRHNFDQRIADGDDVGNYDFGSIMHYGAFGFAIDPSLPTIISPQPIGQRTALSAGDIAAVASIYP